MQGVYLTFFRKHEAEQVEIGALGNFTFQEGLYIYAGSGRNSIEKRVERHFTSQENKFWHIDYFSEAAEPVDYFILPEESSYECRMASILEKFCEPVPEFGSSDCDCESHLFRFED